MRTITRPARLAPLEPPTGPHSPRVKCASCRENTSEGKPFCVDCVGRLPAASEILAELALRASGAVCESIQVDVLASLAFAPRSVESLARVLDLPVDTVKRNVRALKSAKRVRQWEEKSRRGKRATLVGLVRPL